MGFEGRSCGLNLAGLKADSGQADVILTSHLPFSSN